MSDGTIGNVKAMCRDEGAPTAPLAEFLEAYNDDDNWWWQISCGHHQNLFDAAVDERDDALAEVHRLTEENQQLRATQLADEVRRDGQSAMTTITAVVIVVHDRPRPQGSKRHVGHGRMIESSAELPVWREAVKQAATDQAGRLLLNCPLAVAMTFTLPKPASAPKRRRTWPMRTPDVSKLARSTEDALTAAGIWTDDARVVEYTRLAKVYPGEGEDALETPGCVIRIHPLESEAEHETYTAAGGALAADRSRGRA